MKKKIYVGCGEDRLEHYLHADIRALPGVDFVCKAWELSKQVEQVEHIFSRHMLEHLTTMEADLALRDWLKALKLGGSVRIIVPNMNYHCLQWLSADWNEESIKDKWSDARHSFASIYGWQRECDPCAENYNQSYWDVHKSGYNEKRMRFLLERIGYTSVEIHVEEEIHLVANAIKTQDPIERPSRQG